MRYAILFLMILISCVPAVAETLVVYPNGMKDIAVPASQYINVFTEGGGTAEVYKQVGYPNQPNSWALETGGNVANEEVSFGPYTNATTIQIRAGTDKVYYSVGAGGAVLPVSRPSPRTAEQLTVTAGTTTSTVTSAALLGGILTDTHSTALVATYTLPTGALLDAAAGLQIGQGFRWTFINLSTAAADKVTIAAGSGHSIVGVADVQSAHISVGGLYGNAATFYSKKTAADTFISYRID